MNVCESGNVRNAEGICVSCPVGKESYRGRCVDSCEPGSIRNILGYCQ